MLPDLSIKNNLSSLPKSCLLLKRHVTSIIKSCYLAGTVSRPMCLHLIHILQHLPLYYFILIISIPHSAINRRGHNRYGTLALKRLV